MIFLETALGRLVPQGQESEAIRDLILRSLFDYQNLDLTGAIGVAEIARFVRVAAQAVQPILNTLVQDGLVERAGMIADVFRLSPQGARYVQESPWARGGVAIFP